MLEAKNISKTYPGEDYGAVIDVSLRLAENQILALVGKSGSGKSTMLQIIAGLMKPDQGSIAFKGALLENPEEQLIAGHHKIKVVFQDFQLKPNMTVEENVRYMLLQFDKAYQTERTEELLSLCNLSGYGTKKPKELSGGQKQRLSIARALADDPELLLMDEPFSNLDPLTKQDLLIELVDIVKSEGLGLIFVTHDTRDAMLIADQVAFLSGGELIQKDTTKQMYNHPFNLDIAKFFGRVNSVSEVTNEPNTYVRAESLRLGESFVFQFEVLIQKSVFLGDQYMLETIDDNTKCQYFLYSSEDMVTHQKVLIGFNASDILRF